MRTFSTIQFKKKCKIGDYQYAPSALIGVGVYGKVYKGHRIADKLEVAVKVVDLNLHPDKEASKFVQNQLKIHQILKHQRVIDCHHIFRKNNIYYFITEYLQQGDLEKHIKEEGPLSEHEALRIFYQIVEGLVYLKKKKVIHRDIKPANIFMKQGNIKIADFGLSVLMDRDIFVEELRIGTPRYMAPETLRQGIYSFKCDVWSLGSLFIEMMMGEAPLARCATFQQVTERVLGQMIPPTLNLSPECRAMLESIFVISQRDRISVDQLQEHPIFNIVSKKYSSGSTTDSSQIQIEDMAQSYIIQPSLARGTSSLATLQPKTPTFRRNPHIIKMFETFIRKSTKYGEQQACLNFIYQKFKVKGDLPPLDRKYLLGRVEQRINELARESSTMVQMQVIELTYFKNTLEALEGRSFAF